MTRIKTRAKRKRVRPGYPKTSGADGSTPGVTQPDEGRGRIPYVKPTPIVRIK